MFHDGDDDSLDHFITKYDVHCSRYRDSKSSLFRWKKNGIDGVKADMAELARALRQVHADIVGDVDFA